MFGGGEVFVARPSLAGAAGALPESLLPVGGGQRPPLLRAPGVPCSPRSRGIGCVCPPVAGAGASVAGKRRCSPERSGACMAPGALVCLCCWRGPRSLPRLVLQRRTSPVPLYLPLGSHRAPRNAARHGRAGRADRRARGAAAFQRGGMPGSWESARPRRVPREGKAGCSGGLPAGAPRARPGLRAPRGTLARLCRPVPSAASCSHCP